MSTGLDASTVTPGRTAPLVSRTSPEKALCAWLAAGKSTTTAVVIRNSSHALLRARWMRDPTRQVPTDVTPTLRRIRPPTPMLGGAEQRQRGHVRQLRGPPRSCYIGVAEYDRGGISTRKIR